MSFAVGSRVSQNERLRRQAQRMASITYHINDAIAVSGLGRTHLYLAMKAGEIEYRKIGKRRLIVADSLENYLLGNQTAQAA